MEQGARLVRSRRKVALTDAGRSFLPKVAKLLQDAIPMAAAR